MFIESFTTQKVIKTFFLNLHLNCHMVFESRLDLIIRNFSSNLTYINAKLWLKFRNHREFKFPDVE